MFSLVMMILAIYIERGELSKLVYMISLWKVRREDFIIFLSAVNVCKCTKVCLRVLMGVFGTLIKIISISHGFLRTNQI